jgi:hypothetical protein
MFALGITFSLMILKAHPDGDNVGDDDCRKLADYYCRDKSLCFCELDRENLAGWLVSKGAWNAYNTKDYPYFDIDP